MPEYTWKFSSNDSNEPEGPNDAGISHFTGQRLVNVIRESIQNSLDVRADKSKPVEVQIELVSLNKQDIGSASLERSLNAAAGSPHNDESHSKQFKRGRNLLRKNPEVNTLRITDRNTTGADDNTSDNGAPSKWQSLTKSTGLSIKDEADAAGSCGLGKHAPFALTPIRTVLYSTAWISGDDTKLQRRFQGKTILVSHFGAAGEPFRKLGYLGNGYEALCDSVVPEVFQLGEPGLSVYIPCYEPEVDWETTSAKTVISNFFHAIVQQGLKVKVDNLTVDQNTVDQFDADQKTSKFIRVSRTIPVNETEIEGIGRVTLRVSVDKSSGSRHRQIALVRDAGMMISDKPSDMKLSGLARIPSHWYGFTAIIECLSEGKPSVLRESESPSHDRISTDQIADRLRKNQANVALRKLGNWCRDSIRELAEPTQSDNVENAIEMVKFLSIEDEEATSSDERNGVNQEILATVPQQSNLAPRGNLSRQGRRLPGSVVGGTGPKISGGGGKTSGTPQGTTTSPATSTFARVRFKPGIRRPTHSVVVTFDKPSNTLKSIQLMASVEDGRDEVVGIREAYAGSRKLSVKHGKISSLAPGKTDRCSIEFVTQVPVVNKTFYLMAEGQ